IKEAQLQQKEYYDKKIKLVEFRIEDQVLIYDLVKENVYGDKLRERWKGPYYIHDYGAIKTYKLRTIDGKILKNMVNTDQLKNIITVQFGNQLYSYKKLENR
ncbi:24874_t:CDS:1, partial [Gigaspora margarita]